MASDVTMLRRNYDLQVNTSTSLREELRSKEKQFATRSPYWRPNSNA
jgi:hypothetical protein